MKKLQNKQLVTVHTPLTPKTKVSLFFEKAKPINVARGGIIEEALEALDNNQIQSAAIDVFETEPATESPCSK